MIEKVQQIMKMVDHSLLSPTLTDQALIEGCEIAAKYHTASVCVKPFHVKLAAKTLKDSDVVVGSVVGFPHGNSTTEIKAAESEQILADGAVEVDMVVNIGKVLSKDWEYIRNEIFSLHEITKKQNATLKVIFENDFLPDKNSKVTLCKICSEIGVEFVKTSTGYNYVKGSDGKYHYQGATLEDLKLMIDNTAPTTQVKAAGHSGSLDIVLKIQAMGVTRTGTGQTKKLFEDAVEYFGK